jgi:Family of unknown function (DUF6328)
VSALAQRVRHGLNEARILILGAQVMLGFHFRAPLEAGYEQLTSTAIAVQLGGLLLLLVAVALLMAPAAYHRIVEEGHASARIQRFTTVVMTAALVPFGLAFCADVYVAFERGAGPVTSAVAAGGFAVTAAGLWFVLPLTARRATRVRPSGRAAHEVTPLEQRVEQVLSEIRMVLPGAQALLGFGFAATLMEAFERLPASSRAVHMAGVACVALATIVLMTPAARHRLVEGGADTEAFHDFASRFLLAAMALLALGISAEFFVVMRRITDSVAIATIGSVMAGVVFAICWFGVGAWARRRDTVRDQSRHAA